MFIIHRIFPSPFQNEYLCPFVIALSLCSFTLCFIPRSRNPITRVSVLSLINKPWPIILEILLFTHFFIAQMAKQSKAVSSCSLISIYLPPKRISCSSLCSIFWNNPPLRRNFLPVENS